MTQEQVTLEGIVEQVDFLNVRESRYSADLVKSYPWEGWYNVTACRLCVLIKLSSGERCLTYIEKAGSINHNIDGSTYGSVTGAVAVGGAVAHLEQLAKTLKQSQKVRVTAIKEGDEDMPLYRVIKQYQIVEEPGKKSNEQTP